MKVTKQEFGLTKNGEQVHIYRVRNKNGMEASYIDYGANIVHIVVPDKDGNFTNVNLGFDNVEGYEVNMPGLGSFIGRVANRIANAVCVIDGKKYELDKNDGGNCLHGGRVSYNKHMYVTKVFEENDSISIEFSRLSPDMEQGFPGNLDVKVTYTLTDENELMIGYYAASDKDTVLNLTNHAYFNLSGHDSGDVLKQQVMINAGRFTITDKELIPTGELVDVGSTPLDFRVPKPIGQDINADYEPLKMAGGYDHNYVLDDYDGTVRKVAELYDEGNGRFMEVYTDLPGMQLYTGNFLTGIRGMDGGVYDKRAGVCFETQYFPNSCNMDEWPGGKLKADEEFKSVTIYKFSVKK